MNILNTVSKAFLKKSFSSDYNIQLIKLTIPIIVIRLKRRNGKINFKKCICHVLFIENIHFYI